MACRCRLTIVAMAATAMDAPAAMAVPTTFPAFSAWIANDFMLRSPRPMPSTSPPTLATTSTVSVPRFLAAILRRLRLMRDASQQRGYFFRGRGARRLFRPDREIARGDVFQERGNRARDGPLDPQCGVGRPDFLQ